MRRIIDLEAGEKFRWGGDTYLVIEDCGVRGIVSITSLTGSFILWLEEREGEVLRKEFAEMEVEVIN